MGNVADSCRILFCNGHHYRARQFQFCANHLDNHNNFLVVHGGLYFKVCQKH